jgi:hypothetical protein
MYTLELHGFLNFKRIPGLTKEEARKKFAEAKRETYHVSNGEPKGIDCKWAMWELYNNGILESLGEF